MTKGRPEVVWLSALCDDDYEFLGVPDASLRSSWGHCRDIVTTAEANGFDNVLLLAVRCGEMWPPQLAREPRYPARSR